MGRVWIRTYTYRKDPVKDGVHSFYVGRYEMGGLSSKLATFQIYSDTTLKDIRQMIEYHMDKGMVRRSVLYSQLLHLMSMAGNPHSRPESDKLKYVFGTIRRDQTATESLKSSISGFSKQELNAEEECCYRNDVRNVPLIIQEEIEEEPLSEIFGDSLIELIVVPLKLVRPGDSIVTAGKLAESYSIFMQA